MGVIPLLTVHFVDNANPGQGKLYVIKRVTAVVTKITIYRDK